MATNEESASAAHAHAHVETLLDDVDRPVEQRQLGADRGVLREERRHDGGDVAPAEQYRGRYRQPALRFRLPRRERGLGVANRRQDRAAFVEIQRAVVGQVNPARGPVEQAHAELAFQRGEGTHDGGQRRCQRFGGAGQTAAFHDAHERRHRFLQLVHARS
jgi:hypothetical protein